MSHIVHTNPPRDASPAQLPCPQCRFGRLTAGQAALITEVEGNLITLPDFPAWICDVCGHRTYDRAALSRLQTLLVTESRGTKPAAHVRTRGDRNQPMAGVKPPHTA